MGSVKLSGKPGGGGERVWSSTLSTIQREYQDGLAISRDLRWAASRFSAQITWYYSETTRSRFVDESNLISRGPFIISFTVHVLVFPIPIWRGKTFTQSRCP